MMLISHEQTGRHLADDSFKYFFMNENFYILIQITQKELLSLGPTYTYTCALRAFQGSQFVALVCHHTLSLYMRLMLWTSSQ